MSTFTATLTHNFNLGHWDIGEVVPGFGNSRAFPTVLSEDVTFNLAPTTTGYGGFNVHQGSSLTINGGHWGDLGTTISGGTMTINSTIGGGLIDMVSGLGGHGIAGTLSLNGAVGPHETIKIEFGHLNLGDVKDFRGTVDLTHNFTMYNNFPLVTFEGIHATTCNYDTAHHMLELFNARGAEIAAARIVLPAELNYASPVGFHVSDTAAGDVLSKGYYYTGVAALGHNS